MTATARLLALVLALLAAGTGATWAAECSQVGALYRARPTVPAHPGPHEPPPRVRYQLRIGLEPSILYDVYRFQAVSLRTGKVISELRMLRVCGNGRAPCIVAPPSRPKPEEGGYWSEEVELDRDLSVDVRNDAPYAILLPGFTHADWSPDFTGDWLRADLRFFTPEHFVPDLSFQELWVRARCGPAR